MDTISPGLQEAFPARMEFRMPQVLTSPVLWGTVSLVVLFAAVILWRVGICNLRVLACAAGG